MQPIFHLALNVHDLHAARAFYGGVLGCREGRSTERWVDFDFFGHQLSLHLGPALTTADTGLVDGKQVPMPHFGIVLGLEEWQRLAARLDAAGTDWILPPQQRFAGQPGEQWTMFCLDPSGNPLEIKGFVHRDQVFAA